MLAWQGLEWVCPADLKSLMVWWFNSRYKKLEKSSWEVLFYAVSRSIWIARNDLMFNNLDPYSSSLIDLSKCRCAFWIKSSYNIMEYSISDSMRCLKEIRRLGIMKN